MGYEYFEHISDVGVHAEGQSLSAAIECGTEAMLAVMFDPDSIREGSVVSISASAPTPDLLFVEVLNEVLSLQGLDELALKRIETVELEKIAEGFIYRGRALGEKFDSSRHEVRTEVKAATYSRLSYANPKQESHILECVLDV